MKRGETPERRGDVETRRRSSPTVASRPTESAAPAAPSRETDEDELAFAARNRSIAELGALTWLSYAPDRADERAIAGVRVRTFVGKGIEPELVLAALATWARGRDRTGEPFHAIGFTEAVCRGRVGRLREIEHERAKLARDAGDVAALMRGGDLRPIGDVVEAMMRDVARRVGP